MYKVLLPVALVFVSVTHASGRVDKDSAVTLKDVAVDTLHRSHQITLSFSDNILATHQIDKAKGVLTIGLPGVSERSLSKKLAAVRKVPLVKRVGTARDNRGDLLVSISFTQTKDPVVLSVNALENHLVVDVMPQEKLKKALSRQTGNALRYAASHADMSLQLHQA